MKKRNCLRHTKGKRVGKYLKTIDTLSIIVNVLVFLTKYLVIPISSIFLSTSIWLKITAICFTIAVYFYDKRKKK